MLESVRGDSMTTALGFITWSFFSCKVTKSGGITSQKASTTSTSKDNQGCDEKIVVTPAYDVRNAYQRASEVNVCDHVCGDAPESDDPLLFSCEHENHADVCESAWMADKCVS